MVFVIKDFKANRIDAMGLVAEDTLSRKQRANNLMGSIDWYFLDNVISF
jgi:hypothetical protein